jgi:DNA-directed RNA polymerase specialized sigma24 family protein
MMKSTAYKVNVSHGASAVQRSQAYASAQDFCTIFRQDMDSLYSLALTLTGSHELAHQAFLAALGDCRDGSTVFQEWARSWSRRAVIKSAIRLVDLLRAGANDEAKVKLELVASEMDPSARWFLLLNPLERFVFVISVLEGYTVPECAALLGASAREVEQARLRALEQIAGSKQNIVPASYVNGSERTANSISTLH